MEQTERKLIVDTIKKTLAQRGINPSNILYIALNGSRAKGLGSRNSDYDTKVLCLSTKQNYMLQKIKPSFHFSTSVEREGINVELEGVAIDYLTMSKYILTQNMMAYDMFSALPLHTTPLAEDLHQIYLMTYVPAALWKSLKGMLSAFLRKQIGESANRTTNKKAAEVVYLALKLNYICSAERVPPPFNAEELTEVVQMETADMELVHGIFRNGKRTRKASSS